MNKIAFFALMLALGLVGGCGNKKEEKKEERMIPAVDYEERMEEQGIPEIHEKKDFWEPVKRLLDKKKKGKWGYWDEIHIEQDDL